MEDLKLDITKLEKMSQKMRKDIVTMIYNAGSGHPGGSLSCIDILVTLYHKFMNLNENENGRIDKFILSKGHAAPAYYAVLSSVGYIPHEDLNSLRKYNSYLEGHPSNKIPGVDCSSGSLGQGLSISCGMALAKKISNEKGYVYCLLGDGEMQEGQIWESLMSINKFNLNNLIVFVDKNGLQIDDEVKNIKDLGDLSLKLRAFGLEVQTIDGHDFKEIINSVELAKKSSKPNVIIANTIKGKGVSFMENEVSWHGRGLKEDEYKKAMEELG